MNEPISDEKLKEMRACTPLLPPPGSEVAVELLTEIDRLKAENEKLRTDSANRKVLVASFKGENERLQTENDKLTEELERKLRMIIRRDKCLDYFHSIYCNEWLPVGKGPPRKSGRKYVVLVEHPHGWMTFLYAVGSRWKSLLDGPFFNGVVTHYFPVPLPVAPPKEPTP